MRRKVRRPKGRILSPLQQLIFAKELVAGKQLKVAALDWHISYSQGYKIYVKHVDCLLSLKPEYNHPDQGELFHGPER